MKILFKILLAATLALPCAQMRADDDDGGNPRSGSSRLLAPDDAPFPDARGEVVINPQWLMVKVEGVGAGSYAVLLDDGTGTKTEIGTIDVRGDDEGDDDDDGDVGDGDDGGDDDGDVGDGDSGGDDDGDVGDGDSGGDDDGDVGDGDSGDGAGADRPDNPGGDRENHDDDDDGDDDDGDDDDGDDDDGGSGALRLRGELPFGAAIPADLAGLDICVVDTDGAVIVSGLTPAPVAGPPEPRSGKCELSRPDPAVDEDASGFIHLETSEDRMVLMIHLRGLDGGTVYDVFVSNGDEAEAIATTTTNPAGNANFKVDSANGDPLPLGVGNLLDLVGASIMITNVDGEIVLEGVICEPRVVDDDGDDDDDDGDDDGDDGDDDGDDGDDDGDDGDDDGDDGDDDVGDTGDDGGDTGDDGGDTGDDGGDTGDDGGDTGDDGGDTGDGTGAAVSVDRFRMDGDFDRYFLRGDSNNDKRLDISDAINTLAYLFRGGQRPACLDASDVNDDGRVDVADSIFVLTFIFLDGEEPAYPGPRIAGSDMTPDELFCEELAP